MANIVVTGGAGFIGSHLVESLVGRGESVTVFDNFSTGKPEAVVSGARIIEGDIRDAALTAQALKGADYVFHLAALPRIQKSIRYPQETNEVNVQGTLNVLEGARTHHVKRVIFASSSSVYGPQAHYPLKETMVPQPLSPYALQKHIGEKYCQLYTALYGLDTVCLRYFSVYGPGQSGKDEYATIIGKFLYLKKAGRPFPVYGGGEAVRDFTYVSDVVDATVRAMTLETPCRGSVLNICNGKGYSVAEIARRIGGDTELRNRRPGESQRIVGDNRRARKILGWKPQVPLEEGLSRLNAL